MKTLVLISVRTYVYTLYVYLVLPHISPISHNAILTNEYIRPIHTFCIIYMNCWFKAFNVHTYISSSKVECIFQWHLFFCAAMDRSNYSTDRAILMTDDGKLFYLVMVILYDAIIAFTAIVLSLVVRGTIRFVLTNILIASITVCFGIPLICLHGLILNNSQFSSSADVSFQIILAIGGNGRSAFMAIFAVVVVVIIK